METITLLIKGTLTDAAVAINRHLGQCFTLVMENDADTVVKVAYSKASHEAIADWFISPPSDPPYPPGALLHYTLPKPSEVCGE